MRPGDWRCSSCHFLNFARRQSCKSCGAERGPQDEEIEWGESAHQAQIGKPGDWHCPSCNFLNFARRRNCLQCQEPRGDIEGLSEDEVVRGSQIAKPGDWSCSSCHFMNFARRRFCKQCGTPREDGGGEGEYGGNSEGYTPHRNNRWNEGRPGDWHCEACGFRNFARRLNCKSCDAPRPEGAGRDQQHDQNDYRDGYSGEERPGDWTCGSCGYLNFARRQSCGRCGEGRP
ncbi:MAG: zinc finger protein [Myxococcota bacterium]|nr:zinc finger protein [Myxococcota bacterium]